MSSIVSIINYIIDKEGLSLPSFVNVSSFFCFPLKTHQKNGSKIPVDVVDQCKEFRKNALHTVLVHLWEGYVSTNDIKVNGEANGLPISKWLKITQMKDDIVLQVGRTKQRIWKRKIHYDRWTKIVKDPSTISANENTEFCLLFCTVPLRRT